MNDDYDEGIAPVTRPPRQWTRADLDATYAAGRTDLVADALKAGQLASLLNPDTEGDTA